MSKFNTFYYLASPYTHKDPDIRQKRFDDTCRAVLHLVQSGLLVYSPIVASVPIANLTDDPYYTTWGFWKEYDESFMYRCDHLLILTLDGWQFSEGMKEEIKIANHWNMPMSHVDPKTYKIVHGPGFWASQTSGYKDV